MAYSYYWMPYKIKNEKTPAKYENSGESYKHNVK